MYRYTAKQPVLKLVVQGVVQVARGGFVAFTR
jgi:hypothetical protein